MRIAVLALIFAVGARVVMAASCDDDVDRMVSESLTCELCFAVDALVNKEDSIGEKMREFAAFDNNGDNRMYVQLLSFYDDAFVSEMREKLSQVTGFDGDSIIEFAYFCPGKGLEDRRPGDVVIGIDYWELGRSKVKVAIFGYFPTRNAGECVEMLTNYCYEYDECKKAWGLETCDLWDMRYINLTDGKLHVGEEVECDEYADPKSDNKYMRLFKYVWL